MTVVAGTAEGERVLTRDLFGTPKRPAYKDLFGRGFGWFQARGDSFIRNNAWFNQDGERIGCGDLSKDDLRHLSQHMPPGEALLTLPESWIDRETISREMLVRTATRMVADGRVYRIFIGAQGTEMYDGLLVHLICPGVLRETLEDLS